MASSSDPASASAIAFGQRAKDLVYELRNAETLPSYNDEAVRSIIQETTALAREAESLAREASGADRRRDDLLTPLQVFAEGVARNRRCLLAYQ